PFDAERLLFARVGDAESEGRQRASARESVERRPLLGQHDGVAARQDLHARAELELLRAAGGDGGGDDRIRAVAGEPFRQAQRVEARTFERVDERGESCVVVGDRAGAKPVADAHLHDSTPFAISTSSSATRSGRERNGEWLVSISTTLVARFART